MKLKTNKIHKRMFTCLLLVAICCGCTQSEVVTDDRYGNGGVVSACCRLNNLMSTMGQTRRMAFKADGTMETDSVLVSPADDTTRSAIDPGETADKTIQNLWVGQYDAQGDLVAEDYFSSLATPGSVNLPLKRMEGTCHVWVIANAGNMYGKASDEKTLKALTTSGAFTDDGLPVSNLCVMTGMWSGTIMENISADITLKRSLAKIKFIYSVGGNNFSFTPATIELCNVPVSMKYIGDDTPQQLSGDENFKTYTVTSPGNSGTHCWYIPENPAGTGSNATGAATTKIGEGVTHATCIRLTGEAAQDGVTYGNVVFTLYPGNGNNDYNIVRNGLYTIEITLTGIDFSDKRVTVGTVPEMQDPENLGAEKGATGIFQVTTRPGMPWSFTIPNWLSAVIGNQTYESGTKLDFMGPYQVKFETTTANPGAAIRETSFTVGKKEIYVRQNASSLSVGSSSISLNAEGFSTGSSTFKATKGLPWAATLASEWGSWLAWNGDTPTSGMEATGGDETLAVKATSSNPSASSRSGTISLKGGDAISGTGETGLTGSISVTQAGASINVTDLAPKLGPEAAEQLSNSFVATRSLPWVATVTSGNDWLTLLSTPNGTTTGSDQSISYKTALNLNASDRKGNITVSVGNGAGDAHPGPSANITVIQKASVVNVSPATLELENTATSGTVSLSGTNGLPWTVSRTSGSEEITVSPSGGTLANVTQTLTFSASENTGDARSATFTVGVTGGNHSKTMTVNQVSGLNLVTINQKIVNLYKTSGNNIVLDPPFNYDYGVLSNTKGNDYKGNSSTCIISESYIIEVERTQSHNKYVYSDGSAKKYCTSKGDNWRLPTVIEVFAMWNICKGENEDATDSEDVSTSLGEKFMGDTYYWTSSVYNRQVDQRCIFGFFNCNAGHGNLPGSLYIRCVRDIK